MLGKAYRRVIQCDECATDPHVTERIFCIHILSFTVTFDLSPLTFDL
jgi:hypothetical protein